MLLHVYWILSWRDILTESWLHCYKQRATLHDFKVYDQGVRPVFHLNCIAKSRQNGVLA